MIHCTVCNISHTTIYEGENMIKDYSMNFAFDFRVCRWCLHKILLKHLVGKKCMMCNLHLTKRQSGLCDPCSKKHQEFEKENGWHK